MCSLKRDCWRDLLAYLSAIFRTLWTMTPDKLISLTRDPEIHAIWPSAVCAPVNLYLREAIKNFFNSTIKKNASNAYYSSFFNIVTAKFNAFAKFLCQTVYALKIKFFCMSLQPWFHCNLQKIIVWIEETTKMRLQISKQIIVTGSEVRTVCRMI